MTSQVVHDFMESHSVLSNSGRDGFGGLVVSMVPEFAGSIPTEAVGFFPM
jgi:hypothetical protein